MIGMHLTHTDGTSGRVTATWVQADGTPMARINDRWLPVSELVA